ncbi:mCG1042816 [Mus musculus]|nr:mCG1042816 [Mus musculus]
MLDYPARGTVGRWLDTSEEILTFLGRTFSSVMMSLVDKTHKTTKSNHVCGFSTCSTCFIAKEFLSLCTFKDHHTEQARRDTSVSKKEALKHTAL